MATTMGGSKLFLYDDLVVAQDAAMDIGKRVQTLVIELNQLAYGAYLSSPRNPKAIRGCNH